ncbi:MAG: DUF3604 domain-containing protein [Deltaproteobacteria bacterium]|jgi:hypothetical protein|nr:DUF3604 domain-containing protein [Deltaproteobacteria bacterium]
MGRSFLLIASLGILANAGCGESTCPTGEVVNSLGQCVPPDEPGRCADFDPRKQVYWGDTHVHTDLSFDANMQGTRTTQADAYSFARGEAIPLQPYEEDGTPTRMAQIDRPLDFVMLSDHAEFLGTLEVCNDPDSPGYDARQCVDYRAAQEFDADPQEVVFIFVEINGQTSFEPEDANYPALCGSDASLCIDAGMDVWAGMVDAAESAYDLSDSCELTTFPGYEWSGGPMAKNLHRNVMFKNSSVTDLPYNYFDEPYAEGLWQRLEDECIAANTGCDVLTIPHNTNLSEGIYFEYEMANGEPFTPQYAERRRAMEPVIEIYQHKGASECFPGDMSSDELCGFEIIPFSNLATTNQNRITPPDPKGFLRHAYGEGMKLEESLGTNPFGYGITAATDTHISAPGFIAEDDFKGHGGAGQPNRYLPSPEGFPDIEYLSPGGLTAVWAEENARDAIFAAFRNKETFGTSGPRIVVRMFGGWDYPGSICDDQELAAEGYAGGVPMGGTLDASPGATGPQFVVSAKQDPMGAPLQRIQIVKGWLEGGEYQVQVFDVAGDSDNGASVDLDTCVPSGSGASDLCQLWQDPDFDPSERAYYYARVIENPTCRWSTFQCSQADYDCNAWDYAECQSLASIGMSNYTCDCCDPAAGLNVAWCESVDCSNPADLPADEARCCVPRVEPIIQERAWTSPIWYQPPG